MRTYFSETDPEENKNEKPAPIQKVIEQKLLEQRKIFLWGEVDDRSAENIVSKLLYLESTAPGEKITFYINSPGGVITSGYSILDTMKLITSPVSTVCMGLAASMGSLLLSAGKRGDRYIFPLGEVLIHQPSIGYLQGQASDIAIHARQIIRSKEIAADILSKNCNQPVEKILRDFDRDYWMNAEESISYGIVDKLYTMR
ncbi:MAG TPA: ATP-dependent Clp protease proteolytic subunit [Bacteroidales bacterium]|jgi:ATP-dependent Clp protease protease subunit|nr:ATP-dependent Clp protease proteolytic subunit [Bacteroidales bacterium]